MWNRERHSTAANPALPVGFCPFQTGLTAALEPQACTSQGCSGSGVRRRRVGSTVSDGQLGASLVEVFTHKMKINSSILKLQEIFLKKNDTV